MTIGFSQLGNYGRMGNQMFQYAALRGISDNLGYDWRVPTQDKFRNTFHSTSNIFDCFTLEEAKSKMEDVQFQYMIDDSNLPNTFDERIYYTCLDNTDLIGYYQSPKYFEKIEDIIKKEFTFIKKSPVQVERYISLHVRRGDYLLYSHILPPQNEKYFKDALSNFDKNLKVVVSSDDIEWCKNSDIFKSDRFVFSEANPYDDLLMISKACGNIISNSSYSWWGAYLSGNSNVVIPKNWFGPAAPHHKAEEFLKEGWIAL